MRVAVIHFHLRRGGVTRVIETAAEALREHGVDLLVLGGEAPGTLDLPPEQVTVVSRLNYREAFSIEAARLLKSDLEAAARNQWGSLPDIWHVHNHSLAKNLEVPWVVARWAEEGQRLLLQPHDFAEDGRPDNYRKLQQADGLLDHLYPTGSSVLYGLLNSRDRHLLNAAGVNPAQTVPLPNSVKGFDMSAAPIDLNQFGAERMILYPSRSIRRKNVGELLLHAAIADHGTKFGCTLAPENPTAKAIYERWVKYAAANSLPVEFNVGPRTGASLESMMAAAAALITTSVAEGFGLAFLEPWLAGKQLVGRNLPDITGDFTATGMNLEGLYTELPIPLEWLGRDALKQTLQREMSVTFDSYQRPLPAGSVDQFCEGPTIDFGRLDEPLQERVIEHVTRDVDAADQLRSLDLLAGDASLVEDNRTAVRSSFGISDYGHRLHGHYTRLMKADSTACDWLDPGRLLDEFLSPERFCLLRT